MKASINAPEMAATRLRDAERQGDTGRGEPDHEQPVGPGVAGDGVERGLERPGAHVAEEAFVGEPPLIRRADGVP